MKLHPTPAWLITLALAASLTPAADAAPPGRQTVPLPDAAQIQAQCPQALQTARQQLADIADTTRRPRGHVLQELNALTLQVADFLYPVYLLANVAPQAATRDAAQACVEAFTPLDTETYQNLGLYQRVRALKPADATERIYRRTLLDAFADAGATLPPARRERAKALQDELGVLGLAFQKAVNEDDTTVTVTEAQAAGLPPAWMAARRRNDAGQLVLGMDYPTVLPFLQNALDEDARRRVWTAFQNQGGRANIERLDRALALRHELAQLHGQPDFASLTLRRQMAGQPAAVKAFLDQVKAAVLEGQTRELAALREEKAALTGQPLAQVQLQRWDTALLQERLRRARYAVDQEALRDFFPTEASVRYAIALSERLYGIVFVPTDVPVWHPDVRYFDVHERGADGAPGAFIGGVYLDLFPREGKYTHAAAFPVLPGSRLAQRHPVSVLVTNFNPRGLDHDELQTLLHEFGHVLHGVLSTARFAALSGTSVKRDFVEAPSQMLEEWARRPETLAVLAEVCPECPRLSAQQLAQLEQARRFGQGLRYARQWQYASYDMALHTGTPRPALDTWVALEEAMPLGYVEGTLFPAGFGHLMGGYAAGYYGYMWSEVMALDMLSAFGDRLMDPAVGRRYRDLILAPGGERPPQALVRDFLGRDPNPEAFFAEIAGRR
jgi:thimet oligopeptidase